jgi:hypothetical protein
MTPRSASGSRAYFFGGDDGDGDGDDTDSIELVDADPITTAKALTLAKEGRTLSEANRETLMAAHDAVEAALASDMDFETNRFTDSDEYAFDVAQYGDSEEKALEKLTEEQGQLVANAVQRFVDAQGDATFGEFRDWLWQTDALDDDDTAFASDEAAWEFVEWTREQRENAAVSEEFIPYVMAETDTKTEINMSKKRRHERRRRRRRRHRQVRRRSRMGDGASRTGREKQRAPRRP